MGGLLICLSATLKLLSGSICDVCSHWNFTNLVLDQLDYLKGDTTAVAFYDVDIYSVCKTIIDLVCTIGIQRFKTYEDANVYWPSSRLIHKLIWSKTKTGSGRCSRLEARTVDQRRRWSPAMSNGCCVSREANCLQLLSYYADATWGPPEFQSSVQRDGWTLNRCSVLFHS